MPGDRGWRGPDGLTASSRRPPCVVAVYIFFFNFCCHRVEGRGMKV